MTALSFIAGALVLTIIAWAGLCVWVWRTLISARDHGD